MRLRLFAVAAVLAALMTASHAHAQVGLYFNPVVSRVSVSAPDTGTFAFLGDNTTSRIFGGVDFGGYYDFAHYAKFDVGVDFRDTIQHGNNALLNDFAGGLRVASKPLAHNLKPYAEVMVGAGRTRPPQNAAHVTKLEANVLVGVDRPLNRHVDWRIIEVGYGSLSVISSGVYNSGTTPIATAKVINFSTGFVFRFP